MEKSMKVYEYDTGGSSVEVTLLGEDMINVTVCERWGGWSCLDDEPGPSYASCTLTREAVNRLVALIEGRPQPWDKDADQDALCTCGHPYYRHFDTYEDMYPNGCKYCACREFQPAPGAAT